MYKIKISSYNHVSGHDAETAEELYTDLNTAKRAMLKLLFEDDNIWEEDATVEIGADLMSAIVEGRHDDYTEFSIREAEEVIVNSEISDEITLDEINEMIEEAKKENNTLTASVKNTTGC